MELTTKEIIEEVKRRRDLACEEKIRRFRMLDGSDNNYIVTDAYNFYRGIEYELNKLLDWLGYEE